MPRGRKRKFKLHFNLRTDVTRTVVALVFVLLAAISLVSFIFPHYSINAQVLKIITVYFGSAAFLVPVILGMTGFVFIDRLKSKFKELRVLGGMTVLTLSLAGFLSSISGDKLGGRVGDKISSFLADGVSIYGAFAVLIILMLISVFVVFNVSLDQVIKLVAKYKPNIDLGNLKKKQMEEELEVSTDYGDSLENGSREKEQEPFAEVEEEVPAFEVIPSISEPQQNNMLFRSKIAEPLFSEVPNIPRLPSDRIWQSPPLDLLVEPQTEIRDTSDSDKRSKLIKETLKNFGIEVEIADVKVGPSVTQYSLQPKSVTKISKIASLHENLALALASPTGSVRIEAPIPGKSLIGIEVPNTNRTIVHFKSLLTSDPMRGMKSKLGITLGKDVAGKTYVYDIAKMPHMLIAGTTGSGKSVFIHNIMLSILYKNNPQECQFILIDPKRVELKHYEGIPHLITPIVADMDKAPSVFKWAVAEMEKRYRLFEQAKVSNIDMYNERSGIQAMPYILIVVDELAEIMIRDPAGVEKSIIRLAQLARATGIHLILAVQRPSTNVVTGLIKANITCRAAFSVASQIDSRVIIDQPGAEKLLGKGDMLFVPPDAAKPTRLQGAFVSYPEVDAVVSFLKGQGIEPDYKDEVLRMETDHLQKVGSSDWGSDVDPHFDEAVDIIKSLGKASASLLQRKLSIGYARAARIIDEMEAKGIIGPAGNGSKAREVLISGVTGDINNFNDSEQF